MRGVLYCMMKQMEKVRVTYLMLSAYILLILNFGMTCLGLFNLRNLS